MESRQVKNAITKGKISIRACLNGVQEVASSNLVTQTIKRTEIISPFFVLLLTGSPKEAQSRILPSRP